MFVDCWKVDFAVCFVQSSSDKWKRIKWDTACVNKTLFIFTFGTKMVIDERRCHGNTHCHTNGFGGNDYGCKRMT